MTVEELEIIIRANIKDAIGPIKQIVKEVKNAVAQSIKPMNELGVKSKELTNNVAAISKAKTQLKEFEKAAKETVKKIGKDMKIDFSVFNFNDNSTVEQLKAKMEGLKAVREQIYKNNPDGLFSDNAKKQLDEITYKLLEMEEKLKDVSNKASLNVLGNKEPTTSVLSQKQQSNTSQVVDLKADFDFVPLKEQAKAVSQQLEQLIPIISKIKETVRDTVNDNSSLVYKMIENTKYLGASFGYLKNEISSKMSNVKNIIISPFKNLYQNVKSDMQPIVEVAKNVGKMTSGAFNQGIGEIKDKITEISKTKFGTTFKKAFEIASNGAKKLVAKIREIHKESAKTKKSSSDLGNGLVKSLSSGISSIKKFALGLLSIRTAFNAVSKAASTYLSFDSQLSNSIQNSWNMLGSLLAPALEYVASLFSKLVNTVAAFVKMLTGIDLVARANAKALNKQAGAAKKASEAQLGIDEFHAINENNSGGGDTPHIKTEAVDMSWLDKVKEAMKDFFEPIKNAWDNVGPSIIASAKKTFNNMKELVKSVGKSFKEVWTNGTGEKYLTGVLNIIRQIIDIVGGSVSAFNEAWTTGNLGTQVFQNLANAAISFNDLISVILDSFIEMINNGTITEIFANWLEHISLVSEFLGGLADAFTNAWTNAGNGTSILQSVCDMFIVLQEFSNLFVDSLKSWVISPSFQSALNGIIGFLKDIFSYAKDICEWLLKMYDKYVKPVIDDKLLPTISKIVEAIMAIWDVVKPVVDNIIACIETVLEPVIKGLMDFIGGIIDIIQGVADFIAGVFTGDWKRAWNGIKEIFSGFCNALKSLFTTPINFIISAVEFCANKVIWAFNKVKEMLNKLSFDIPDWVPVIGGQKWGFNFAMSDEISLPRLYNGGAVLEESIVRVADYPNSRNNPEIVSPRDMMKETFKEAIEESNYSNREPQKVEVDITGELRADGNDLVYVYDKTKNDKGYDGKNNPSFVY